MVGFKQKQITKKQRGFVSFGAKSLFEFGMNIGHLLKKSKFFTRWCLQGVGVFFFMVKDSVKQVFKKLIASKSYNFLLSKKKKSRSHSIRRLLLPIFLISLSKSVIGVRSLINMAKFTGFTFGRGWFICHNQLFIPFTLRYAMLLGMGYSTYDWVAGCLTNFKKIFSLFYLLYREFNYGFVLEKKHYMFIYRLFGFNITGFWLPNFLFLPRMLESKLANWEGGCLFMKSIGIIDSNVLSGDTILPLPANDDSFLSVNFIFYVFSFHILRYLFLSLKKWRQNIRKLSYRKEYWILYYFTFYYRSINYRFWRNYFRKFFVFVHDKPYFFSDFNQIYKSLVPFGSFSFGLDCQLDEINTIDFKLNKFS